MLALIQVHIVLGVNMSTKETTNVTFYVTAQEAIADNLVLYSTMGGNKLLNISRGNSEWETLLGFRTEQAAHDKIKEMIESNDHLVSQVQLQVLKRTYKTIITDELFAPIQTKADVKRAAIIKARPSFELAYANGPSTDYSYPGDVAKHRSEGGVGYTNEAIDKAFEQYLKMFNIIK